MSRNRILTALGLLPGLLAVLVSGCAPWQRPPSPAPSVRAEVGFRCLWWSETQMEGLNPNAPPPKNTEVKLTKWEYSDPVGVPHPDTVDVDIRLTNSTDRPVSGAEVQVNAEWKRGPLHDAPSANWSEPELVQEFRNVSLPSSGSQTLRFPVDLKSVMESLGKSERWPYGLRVTVTVRMPGTTGAIARASGELPISPGD